MASCVFSSAFLPATSPTLLSRERVSPATGSCPTPRCDRGADDRRLSASRTTADEPGAARRRRAAGVARSTLQSTSTDRPCGGAGKEPCPELTVADLVAYMASGCKPRSSWRIGTEHEKFGFYTADGRAIGYDAIEKILVGLRDRYKWDAIMEGDHIIGVSHPRLGSVTLEPGGQFELSGAPVETLHMTAGEVAAHIHAVKSIAAEMGINFLGLGFNPKWAIPQLPMMPKGRYALMREYMPKVGTMGLDMMFRTCTVQVNLDFESEADMAEKLRIGIALQPVATALFANSPFKEGAPNGYSTLRAHVWTDVDKARTGCLPFAFEPGFGFERYVRYALDVPMYFAYRDGVYVNCTGASFRDFLAGKLPQLPGDRATLFDWEQHLTTIFPEVRLKRFLEMRGADVGPEARVTALSALWVGLLYSAQAQAAAAALIADWTVADIEGLRATVPRLALRAPFRGATVRDLALQVLAISRRGLADRGLAEERYLDELDEIAESGMCPADRLLEAYGGRWAKNIDMVYKEGPTFW